MVYTTTQHPSTPPSPHSHTLSVYTVQKSTFSLGRGGGQREGRVATVHKYSSFVNGGNSSQAGSKNINHGGMYLQSIKPVKQNAAGSSLTGQF
jgi:hypothetical protein